MTNKEHYTRLTTEKRLKLIEESLNSIYSKEDSANAYVKTLALINIDSRMPFNDFIDKLYEKYGFIIGSKHSILLIETYSDNDYKKNEARLFERLRALGLLESKSDGYAYVINRYGRK